MATTSTSDLVRRLLDRGYSQYAERVVLAIAASTSRGIIRQRLDDLLAEAGRLAEAGERLGPDNSLLRALLADLDDVMAANTERLRDAGPTVQTRAAEAAGIATRQLALPGITPRQILVSGIRWNTPDPEAVAALVNYTDRPAWENMLRRYGADVTEIVRNQAIMGLAQGWNPLRTAESIGRLVPGLPASVANTTLRTLQLQAFRSATAIHQTANSHILTEQIRVATLDERVCLACVALHGSRLPVGERVNDHHNGRCIGIGVVTGRPRELETGPEWYERQPETVQMELAGPEAYELLRTGRAQLRDFVVTYQDEVFDEMIRRASVNELLARGL